MIYEFILVNLQRHHQVSTERGVELTTQPQIVVIDVADKHLVALASVREHCVGALVAMGILAVCKHATKYAVVLHDVCMQHCFPVKRSCVVSAPVIQ